MEMRLVDAVPLSEKIQAARAACTRRGDVRAEKALAYVLELLEDAPGIPICPDTDRMKRKRYGKGKKVLLSDDELGQLQNEFPHDWQARIDRLDEYIAQFGNRYKSHLATIRNWARRDEKQENGGASFDEAEFMKLALEKTYGGAKP